MPEIIEPNREFKVSIGTELKSNKTYLNPSLYKEVKREVEKYGSSSDISN